MKGGPWRLGHPDYDMTLSPRLSLSMLMSVMELRHVRVIVN